MRNAGVVIGTVKKLKDPRNLGRVKVHFNWLDDRNRTRWARVATLMSGGGRGSWFMPELDDEVLLAFDHGDMQHPYIVGYLWNGQDKPPNDGIDTRVRRIKTVTGHVIDFDDREGKEKILVETQGHSLIEMKDSPTRSIRVKTENGHQLLLDEAAPGTVELKTKGGRRITMVDTPPSIEIEYTPTTTIRIDSSGITVTAPTSPITVSCLQATVTATATLSATCIQATITAAAGLTVSSPMATFTGVVMASSIVSPVYTPGVGNTFGL
jgi:phage baseplate assembly protein gpV